ncbi:hypothetical protein [Legionella yabuuchiae]|uniref:hypothetical protein n=1 Tax=Legionella yabuuchiae TaxID=376727 RepID=UPI001F5E8661|nr:hypothetical protein [Legionella yabuuchiae]
MASLLKPETLNLIINQAYLWLCKASAHRGANSDCWHVRHHKKTLLPEIAAALKRMDYVFSPRTQYRMPDETLSLYCSQDSLLLKAMGLILSDFLKVNKLLSPHCYHVKDHGGLKVAVNHTRKNLKHYRFVFKSDIKGFYEHIHHETLYEDLLTLTGDRPFTSLIIKTLKSQVLGADFIMTMKRDYQEDHPFLHY